MDEYQYSLFFEAEDLTDAEIEKVWRYFQRKRDAGGGECAPIEKVGDNKYKISFKEKDGEQLFLIYFSVFFIACVLSDIKEFICSCSCNIDFLVTLFFVLFWGFSLEQERVLQRKIHTVTLTGGEQRLTVNRTLDQSSTSRRQVSFIL